MRVLDISEIEKTGVFVSSGYLTLNNTSYVRGGSFPETSEKFALAMCLNYTKQGIDSFVIRSPGIITIWKEEKTVPPDNVAPTTRTPAQSQGSVQNAPVEGLPTLKRSVIVYIDDSPTEVKLMELIIREMNLDFHPLIDSVKALSRLIKLKPDLIFLDLNMPIVSGYEICAQIRRINTFKETPIIMVTSSDGLIDRMRAKISGATDFIAKPIDRDKISEILQKYYLI